MLVVEVAEANVRCGGLVHSIDSAYVHTITDIIVRVRIGYLLAANGRNTESYSQIWVKTTIVIFLLEFCQSVSFGHLFRQPKPVELLNSMVPRFNPSASQQCTDT